MVVTQSILSFLLSIIISLGGSVTVDNVGQDFSTIYNNQNPFVQKQIDQCAFAVDPTGQLMTNLKTESIKLTTEMLYDIQGGKVSNEVINDTIGYDAWRDFVMSNQGNIIEGGSTPTNRVFVLGNGRTIEIYTEQNNDGSAVNDYYSFKIRITDKEGNILCNGLPWQFHYAWQYLDKSDAERALSLFTLTDEGILTTYKADGTLVEVVDISYWFGDDYNGGFVALGDGSIGQITDATIAGTQIGQLPIAVDGSITLPDGTKVYPNSDGTYNIDNRVYSPTYNIGAYDDSALLGLLQQILQKVGELENKLEFEKEKEEDKELEDKQQEALDELDEATDAATDADVLSKYTYSSMKWANIFPFCIPWDFVRGVKLLSASPVAPKFTIPFEIPEFGSFGGYKSEIVLDFSEYETYFKPVRWFTTTFFLISLGFITFKIVKGAA